MLAENPRQKDTCPGQGAVTDSSCKQQPLEHSPKPSSRDDIYWRLPYPLIPIHWLLCPSAGSGAYGHGLPDLSRARSEASMPSAGSEWIGLRTGKNPQGTCPATSPGRCRWCWGQGIGSRVRGLVSSCSALPWAFHGGLPGRGGLGHMQMGIEGRGVRSV